MSSTGTTTKRKSDARWILVALPLVAIGAGLWAGARYFNDSRGGAFVGVLILLALELLIIGQLVNGRFTGAFIDNRNRMSLSKLQAAAWTCVVLAGLATIAIYNLVGQGDSGGTTDLNVTIPPELLAAMGLSATSLVATPILLSAKAAQDPSSDAVAAAKDKLGVTSVGDNGKVVVKPTADDASWGDLVTGDEMGNAGFPDLGKIQNLLITVLLLGSYAGYIFIKLSTSEAPLHELPKLDQGFVWLLTLSHGSYLAYKAAPHTQSADT